MHGFTVDNHVPRKVQYHTVGKRVFHADFCLNFQKSGGLLPKQPFAPIPPMTVNYLFVSSSVYQVKGCCFSDECFGQDCIKKRGNVIQKQQNRPTFMSSSYR
jgi:hypothetical protein